MAKERQLKIEYRPIGKLVPYINNARKHSPQQVDFIVKLIQEYGWTNPILVDGKNGIVAGHGRLMAAKQLKMRTVPVIELAGMTPGKKRAYIIGDNKAAEEAGWDQDLLKLELGDLKGMGIDMELTGFGLREIDFMLEPTPNGATEPPIVEPKGPAVSRKGDIWTLGRHRLGCGKAEDPEIMDALMDTNSAHLVFTDPPYGVSYEARSGSFEMLKGDDLRRGQLYDFLRSALQAAMPHVRNEAAWYIWHANVTRDDFARAMRDVGLMEQANGYIVWVKPPVGIGWSDYKSTNEPCFYAARQGVKPAFYGGKGESNVWRFAAQGNGLQAAEIGTGIILNTPKGQELYVSLKAPAGRKVRHVQVDGIALLSPSGTDADDVWEVSRETGHGREAIHPTQKPVELARRAMRNSSQEGENVLDQFSGSASTIMAGEQLGRNVYALDLDPLYVDAGIRRWQTATGNHATLEGRTFDQVAKARLKHAEEKAPAKASRKAKAQARAA